MNYYQAMKRIAWGLGLCASASFAAAWIHQSSNFYIGGNLASSDVIMHNGSAYVPVKDVAAALKMTVQKTGRGLELTSTGGANQASGVNGKVGDVLWNGYIRLQVVQVIRSKEYTNQFSNDNQKVMPTAANNDLVVIVCKMKNGLNNGITVEYPGAETALADTDGQSYSPRLGMTADIPGRGVDLLPGAAFSFALTFDVPSKAVLGDLVYQPSLAGSGTNGSDKKKFRISVKQ